MDKTIGFGISNPGKKLLTQLPVLDKCSENQRS